MKPLELTCTLRNNRLKQRREEACLSRKALAEKAGVKATEYGRLEGLKKNPWNRKHDRWGRDATRLAAYYGVPEEDLFPRVVRAVQNPEVRRRLDEDEVGLLVSDYQHRLLQSPEEIVSNKEQCQIALAIADSLGGKHGSRVLAERVGLDGEGERTLDEIADRIGVSKTRAGQIERGCLRRIRSAFMNGETRRTLVDDVVGEVKWIGNRHVSFSVRGSSLEECRSKLIEHLLAGARKAKANGYKGWEYVAKGLAKSVYEIRRIPTGDVLERGSVSDLRVPEVKDEALRRRDRGRAGLGG